MNKDIFDIFKKGGVILAPPLKEDAWYHKIFKIGVVKNESFDWKPYRPKFETQRNTVDCTGFSRCNCAEYVAKKADARDEDGNELNFSDLHLAVGSGITIFGGNLNSPSEYFRKEGIVIQKYCDYDDDMLSNPVETWKKRQMKVDMIPMGTRRYKGGNHCWIKPEKKIMIDALDWSPLQIAVGVDEKWEQGGIIPRCDNSIGLHAVSLEKINKDGTYRIFDSGFNEEKTLASDYKIIQIKGFRDLPEDWKLTQEQYKEKEKTILDILGEILKKIAQVLGLIEAEIKVITPPPPPVELIDPDIIEPKEELKWGTPAEARHSCRVLMDEFNLAWKEKDLLCAVIQAESRFNPRATHHNLNGSTDWGICQINDGYWIGKDKYFLSTDEVLNFPEKSVRFLVEQYQRGHLTYWVSFKNGTYKQYL